jgi:NhaA family Na+:H+ antiporter
MSNKKRSFRLFLANSITFLLENSAFLIGGALIGLVWANLEPHSYHQVAHKMHFVVNDIAMMFFFLIAGKEIRESMLPGGPLSSVRTAALPVMATFGGMAGPALVYVVGAQVLQPELTRGWAIPMATDIAFSYLVARLIFPRLGGKPHPAIVFLLLLAIADDAGGLIVLAIFYPQGDTNMLVFFVGLALAIGTALLFWKRFGVVSFWPYLLGPGAIAWVSFYYGGIHPALALVPLAWCMPHEHTDTGFWTVGESDGGDTLNRMEHWWKKPVEIILGFFGFVNAGVEFSALGVGTWLVFCGLLFGKPIGVFLMTKLGQLFGLRLPVGMNNRDLLVVGLAAGIGFTVALFISVVAFPAGALQDSVKMGALFSFAVAPITYIVARILGVNKAIGELPTTRKP